MMTTGVGGPDAEKRTEQFRLTTALQDAKSELNDRVNRLFALPPRKSNYFKRRLSIEPPQGEISETCSTQERGHLARLRKKRARCPRSCAAKLRTPPRWKTSAIGHRWAGEDLK